jgi:cytochrome c oxidase subunit 2
MGMKLVVLIVVVLAVIAVAQIMRVYELSTQIRGKREEDVDLRTNNINASLMMVFLLVFFGSLFYMMIEYGAGLMPVAASEIGADIDWLYAVNWWIVIAVFLFTNALLFGFAWKYAYHPDKKAHWFPHDNKLEMIWTVVPAGVLAVIIILGLMTWNKITGEPSDDAMIVEIYGKQFNWTVRYSGDDNKLGYADYKLVGTAEDADRQMTYPNELGVVTKNSINWGIYRINSEISGLHSELEKEANGETVFSEAGLKTRIAKVEKLERIRERMLDMEGMYGDSIDAWAQDDFITKELVLIKGQEYQFILRSQDVLHSAYFPHFRAQMNCVPGYRTTLRVKPTMTTQEMRDEVGDQEFNYILLCNKICGVSHYNMKMPVRVVADSSEFMNWVTEAGNSYPALADTLLAPSTIDKKRMEMPAPAHHGDGHGDEHEEGHGEEGHDDEGHHEENEHH